MKKIISLLMAILMLFSFVPFAAAEGEEAPAEHVHDFTGVAVNKGDGKHSFRCTDSNCTAVGAVIDGVQTENGTEDCSGGTANCVDKAVCDVCKTAYGSVDSSNHKTVKAVEKVDSTCQTAGHEAYSYCEACEKNITEPVEISAKNHSFGTPVSNGDGTHTATCTTCDSDVAKPATMTESCSDSENDDDCYCDKCGALVAHTCEEWDILADATCLGNGAKIGICSVCGALVTASIPKIEHKYQDIGISASCTDSGYSAEICKYCGKLENGKVDILPATGHNFDTNGEAQSNDDGTHSYKCANEGCTAVGTIVDGKQVENGTESCFGGTATCTAKAQCEKCGAEYGELVKHQLVKTDANAPTCTDAGNDEYWTCSVCKKVFSDENGINETTVEAMTVKALGHEIKLVKAADPTCTKTGNKEYWKCERCGKLFSDEKGENETTEKDITIPVVAHKYGTPTWKWSSSYGSATAKFTCAVGKETKSVKATVSSEITKKATVSANGKITYTASVSLGGKTYTDSKIVTVYRVNKDECSLSKTKYVYNGKVQTPSVTVKDAKGNTLKNKTDYTVKYSSGRKYPGTYKAVITFTGKYSGSLTLTYKIAETTVSGIKVSGSKLTWTKVSGASKYIVTVAGKKNTVTKNSFDLKKCGSYKVSIIAYNGSKILARSSTKTVTVNHNWSSSGPECTRCGAKDTFVEYYKIEMKPNEYKVNEKYKSTLYLTVRCKNHNYVLTTKTQPNGFTTKTKGTKRITFSAYKNSKGKVLDCVYYVK